MKKIILAIAVLAAMVCAGDYTHNFDGKWYACDEYVLNAAGDTLEEVTYINAFTTEDHKQFKLVTKNKYNGKHQKISWRDNAGGYGKLAYNKIGKIAKYTYVDHWDNNKVVTKRYTYDDNGILIKFQKGDYTEWYNTSISGRRLTSEDSNGNVAEYYPDGELKSIKGYDVNLTYPQQEYDHLGRVVKDSFGWKYKYFTKGNHHYKCFDN